MAMRKGKRPPRTCGKCGTPLVKTRIGWVCSNPKCEFYDPLAKEAANDKK